MEGRRKYFKRNSGGTFINWKFKYSVDNCTGQVEEFYFLVFTVQTVLCRARPGSRFANVK